MKTFADVTVFKDFNELFELMHSNDSVDFYMSKKKYHFKGNGFEFDYHYTISVLDMYEWTGDEDCKDRLDFELKIVPTLEYLHPEYVKGMKESLGLDDNETPNDFDISDYGTGITVGYSKVKGIQNYDDPKIESELEFIASCMPLIEEKGEEYYFDKTWNKMGNNGWGTLNLELNNIHYM